MTVEFRFAVYDSNEHPKKSTHYRVIEDDGMYKIQVHFPREPWMDYCKAAFSSLSDVLKSKQFKHLFSRKEE